MRVLMMLIPSSEVGVGVASPPFRPERCVGAYYIFKDQGADVVLASPAGGSSWMSSGSDGRHDEASAARMKTDLPTREALADTIRFDQVFTDEFDAVLCIGTPGPIWRCEDSSPAARLIAEFLTTGKPVGITPSYLDLAPNGTSAGLLITGSSGESLVLAARALVGALNSKNSLSQAAKS